MRHGIFSHRVLSERSCGQAEEAATTGPTCKRILVHAQRWTKEETMVETSSAAMPEQAQAAKDEAINQAGELKDTALEHVSAVTADAKEKATNVAHDVRRELETQGDTQAKRAASALHDVGSQLSDMANAGQPGPVTDVTRQLADKSRQVASRLEEGGIQAVGDDLRQFARRQPGLFLAAAGVAGFVVTRILRNAQSNGNPTGQTAAPSRGASSPTPVMSVPPVAPLGNGMPAGEPGMPETVR
jgi:hypothetical protein